MQRCIDFIPYDEAIRRAAVERLFLRGRIYSTFLGQLTAPKNQMYHPARFPMKSELMSLTYIKDETSKERKHMGVDLEENKGLIIPGGVLWLGDGMRAIDEGRGTFLPEFMTPTSFAGVVSAEVFPFLDRSLHLGKPTDVLERECTAMLVSCRNMRKDSRFAMTLDIGILHDGMESTLYLKEDQTSHVTMFLRMCREPRFVAQGLREMVKASVITQREAANALAPFIGAYAERQYAATLNSLSISNGKSLAALMPEAMNVNLHRGRRQPDAVANVRFLAELQRIEGKGEIIFLRKKESQIAHRARLYIGKIGYTIVHRANLEEQRATKSDIDLLAHYYVSSGVIAPKDKTRLVSSFS